LLVDAMAGQDAVNVTNAFNQDLHLTGVIMSKLDGDAKGGAALSIKYLTGLPIKFAGVGEKVTDLDIFYPDRMADRILGMGDVVSLVEKAKEVIDEKEAEKQSKKMLEGEYTLEDMLKQMKMVQKMGSLGAIAKMIPGMPNLTDEQKDKANAEMKSFEAVVNSMTPYERRHPETLKYSEKNRIAKGSGKTNADVNRVIRKWEQSKEMMKQMKQYQKSGKVPPGFGGR
jgi:signal recognition particle subunit SRP54